MKRNLKNFIITILTTVITVFIIIFVVFNYVPISWLNSLSLEEQKFGAITTINSSDKISSLPTTLNNNFSFLDAGKIDSATTTLESLTSAPNLATVGTITTGTWNADVLTVTYGGTGVATIADNTLFYGNGTGAITEVATGTTGQLLTLVSGQPAWGSPSVDLGIDYTWTGYHTFTLANFTQASTTNATTTELDITGGKLTIGNWFYNFINADPSVATSSALMTDGNGNLTFGSIRGTLKATSTETVYAMGSGTLDVEEITIPANLLGKNNVIHVSGIISNWTLDGGGTGSLRLDYGGTDVITLSVNNSSGGVLSKDRGRFDFYIFNDGATNIQAGFGSMTLGDSSNFTTASTDTFAVGRGTGAIDSTVDQILKIQVVGNSGGNTLTTIGVMFVIE